MSPRSMRSMRSSGPATPRRVTKSPRRANPHRQGTGGYLAAYKHKTDMERAKPVQSIAMVSSAMPGSGGTSSRRRQSTLMSPTGKQRALPRAAAPQANTPPLACVVHSCVKGVAPIQLGGATHSASSLALHHGTTSSARARCHSFCQGPGCGTGDAASSAACCAWRQSCTIRYDWHAPVCTTRCNG